MQDIPTLKQFKLRAIEAIHRRTDEQRQQLSDIDPRLTQYFDSLWQHAGTDLDDDNDQHSLWEMLCGLKLLRIIRTYPFDTEEVKDAIYDGEGEWQRDAEGYWVHVKDGLKQPGRRQPEVYRWESFQVFCLAAMYGPHGWIATGNHQGDRRLLDTERIDTETGEILDLRRLCTRFILYGPRKINKSGFGAFHNVRDMMKGDYDASIICCANTEKQATILFNKTKDFLLQLDPVSGRRFNGKFLSYSATKIQFQPSAWRQAVLRAIPAGGKMPDGEFASTAVGDEYGSAGYTNGKSDMGATLAVVESSMGPRREPMSLYTTTASLITAGPFMEILDATHRLLLQELDYDDGTLTPEQADDRQMCLLLECDEWEKEEEYLLTSTAVRRKVNPMLGLIAQHSFYDTAVREARMDETKKRETISKLFNVYMAGRVDEWIKPEQARTFQIDATIEQCTREQGWVIFCGLDFSQGDDLHTCGYLAARRHPSGQGTEFFCDFDAWIKQSTLEKSSIRALLEQWIKEGWLHVSPGETFQPSLFIERLDQLIRSGCQFQFFGYDPYRYQDPINSLKSYLADVLGVAKPEQYVVPVSQRNANYTAAVDGVTAALFAPQPFMHLSRNKMWPWLFGNCVLDKDRMENVKPIKRNPGSDSCKVDPIQTICTGLNLFNRLEGSAVSE